MKIKKIVNKILVTSMLIGCMSNVVGCSQQNLDKASEVLANKIKKEVMSNKDKYESDYENDMLTENQDISYKALKDLTEITTTINEGETNYKIVINFIGETEGVKTKEIYTFILNKNTDINLINVGISDLLENENIKLVDHTTYHDNKMFWRHVVKGYDNITHNYFDKSIYLQEEHLIKAFFRDQIGEVKTFE